LEIRGYAAWHAYSVGGVILQRFLVCEETSVQNVTPGSEYPSWRKTVHVVFKYLSSNLLWKDVGAGGSMNSLII
jgi:hypothetical protein